MKGKDKWFIFNTLVWMGACSVAIICVDSYSGVEVVMIATPYIASSLVAWLVFITMTRFSSIITAIHQRPRWFSDLELPAYYDTDRNRFQVQFTRVTIVLYVIVAGVLTQYCYNQMLDPNTFAERVGIVGGILSIMKRIQVTLGKFLLHAMLRRRASYLHSSSTTAIDSSSNGVIV